MDEGTILSWLRAGLLRSSGAHADDGPADVMPDHVKVFTEATLDVGPGRRRRRTRLMRVFANNASCDRMLYELFQRLQRNRSRSPLAEFAQASWH